MGMETVDGASGAEAEVGERTKALELVLKGVGEAHARGINQGTEKVDEWHEQQCVGFGAGMRAARSPTE